MKIRRRLFPTILIVAVVLVLIIAQGPAYSLSSSDGSEADRSRCIEDNWSYFLKYANKIIFSGLGIGFNMSTGPKSVYTDERYETGFAIDFSQERLVSEIALGENTEDVNPRRIRLGLLTEMLVEPINIKRFYSYNGFGSNRFWNLKSVKGTGLLWFQASVNGTINTNYMYTINETPERLSEKLFWSTSTDTILVYDTDLRRVLQNDDSVYVCQNYPFKARFLSHDRKLVLVFDGGITPLEDDGSIPRSFTLPEEGSLFIGSLEDDSDGDGLPDVWEEDRGLDPHSAEVSKLNAETRLYQKALSGEVSTMPCLDGVRSLLLH
jgi:hypothetical protein